ncbi:hypothetical protein B5E77_08710 [Lachnoclostridium sp. An131]|nr:hypothetical protein B5E77_08710 [Lachnoclostridium sp. An131]
MKTAAELQEGCENQPWRHEKAVRIGCVRRGTLLYLRSTAKGGMAWDGSCRLRRRRLSFGGI